MTTVPTTTDTELNNYPLIADELRRVADAIAPLRTPGRLAISLTLMTPKGDTTEQTVAGVDEVALAVLGKAGAGMRSGDTWFHLARQEGGWEMGVTYLAVQATIPAPPDDRDVELERLRAEVSAPRSAASSSTGGA